MPTCTITVAKPTGIYLTDAPVGVWFAFNRSIAVMEIPVGFATVMVHVGIDGKSDGRIQVAVKLADWFSCDLIGISAALLPPYAAETGYFVTLEAIEREKHDVKA